MIKTKFNPAASAHQVLLLTALGTLAGMGLTPQANAGIDPCVECQSSTVTDAVSALGGGQFLYEYTVNNTSDPGGDLIVDWELPWFDDSTITNIQSPDGWDWAIETIGVSNFFTGWDGTAEWQTPGDPFYEGPDSPYTTGTEVLHWYTCGGFGEFGEGCFGEGGGFDSIFPGGSLDGFGFEASFGPTGAPYQASWAELPVRTGDPAFPLGGGIPASPKALGTTDIPEPGTLPLMVLGAISAFAVSRRRRKQPN